MYFENKLTDNQSNIKKTWEIIREATKKMNDKSLILLKFNFFRKTKCIKKVSSVIYWPYTLI